MQTTCKQGPLGSHRSFGHARRCQAHAHLWRVPTTAGQVKHTSDRHHDTQSQQLLSVGKKHAHTVDSSSRRATLTTITCRRNHATGLCFYLNRAGSHPLSEIDRQHLGPCCLGTCTSRTVGTHTVQCCGVACPTRHAPGTHKPHEQCRIQNHCACTRGMPCGRTISTHPYPQPLCMTVTAVSLHSTTGLLRTRACPTHNSKQSYTTPLLTTPTDFPAVQALLRPQAQHVFSATHTAAKLASKYQSCNQYPAVLPLATAPL